MYVWKQVGVGHRDFRYIFKSILSLIINLYNKVDYCPSFGGDERFSPWPAVLSVHFLSTWRTICGARD